MRHYIPAFMLIVCIIHTVSCARRAPMARAHPAATDAIVEAPSARSTRILEVRPQGVLVTMRPPENISVTWKRAALLRQEPETGVTLLHTTSPDDTQRQHLYKKGLTLMDMNLTPGQRYGYVTALYDEADQLVWRGQMSMHTWQTPPPAPDDVLITHMGARGVRLSWTPRPGWGVLILRRRLGSKSRVMQRHALVPDEQLSNFVDRDVSAETGYVYRLAHARQVSTTQEASYTVLGQPGAEVYAVLPAR